MISRVRSTIGKLRPAWSQRLRSEPGQGLIEYILIISIVALGALLALGFMSGKIQSLYSKSGNRINNNALAPPNGTVSGGGGPVVSGTGQPGTNPFEAYFLWDGHACAYTTTYTFYTAAKLDGHAGALNPNVQGYYTNGLQVSTNVANYSATSATNPLPPHQTLSWTAAQNMAWCLANQNTDPVNDTGGLPNPAPTTIDGYDCGTWHSTGWWSLTGQAITRGQPGSYDYGCYRGPVPVLSGAVGANPPYITCGGNFGTHNCPGATIRADGSNTSRLYAHSGDWLWNPTSYAYTWLSCSGGTCQNVGTGTTYQPGQGDVLHTIQLQVIATNVDGSSLPALSSPPVGPVQQMLPPVCSGTGFCNPVVDSPDNPPIAGQTTFTADPDATSWTPNTQLTFTYQWYSCPTGSNNNYTGCTAIGGANGTTYKPANTAYGQYFAFQVTGHNPGGASSPPTWSDKSNQLNPPAPVNTVKPSFTGILHVGQLLSGNHGTWTGPAGLTITYQYQWQRCTGSNTGCANINGANAINYTLTTGSIDRYIRLEVTAAYATFPNDQTVADSDTQGPVLSAPTGSVTLNCPGQTDDVGGACTVDTSTVLGSATINFTYTWHHCTNAAGTTGCVQVQSGGTSYTLKSSDAGFYLQITVVATNSVGTATFTDTTGQKVTPWWDGTTPGAPTGTAQQGQTLTAQTGPWLGVDASGYDYQWQRSCTSGFGCNNGWRNVGGNQNTYTLGAADVGQTIRVQVQGINTGGNSPQTATSVATGVVTAVQPPSGGSVSIAITNFTDLTATTGSWTNSPTSYTYQWQRTNSGQTTCGAGGNTWTNTGGANTTGSTTNTITPNSPSRCYRVQVYATNAGGNSATLTSNAIATPAIPTGGTVTLNPAATVTLGNPVTATTSGWTNSPTQYTYQWQRTNNGQTTCASGGNTWSNTGGATTSASNQNTTTPGSNNRCYRVVVTATNLGGSSANATSAGVRVL